MPAKNLNYVVMLSSFMSRERAGYIRIRIKSKGLEEFLFNFVISVFIPMRRLICRISFPCTVLCTCRLQFSTNQWIKESG